MIAPILLFCICVGIDWRTSLVLLACVPLIPVSIVAVSKYAKKIFAKYWGKYTSMGDAFLDSVQGLKELKIFKADAARHVKMNASAEEFRKITMKVLVMQLASTTIMDLVAYGGAGVGIALAIVGLMNGWLAPAAALFLVLVAVEFFLPLRSLGSAFHVAMNGASAGRKIISLLNLPDPVWGKNEVTGTQLKLENVTFSYDGKRDVLKNVSMTFPEKGMTAIVGESGCGKSTVTAVFAAHGVPLADADQLSREILLPGSPLLPQLAVRFGADILKPDGTLDRRLLADRAFATPEGKAALDSLTHPAIVARIRAAKQAAQAAGAPLFVLDGAVIVGTAAQAECDRLCVVTAPFETSVARIVARDGISPEMAARRLNAQTPEQTLTAQADYTLHNDAGLEALQAAAARLCEQLQAEGGVTAAP